VALVNQKLEGGKVQIRQVRHEAMNEVKKQLNDKNDFRRRNVSRRERYPKLTDDTLPNSTP